MIIDLSLSRKYVIDQINEQIFEYKLNNYEINKKQLFALSFLVFSILLKTPTLANELGIKSAALTEINTNIIEVYIYPFLLCIFESLKQTNVKEIKETSNYIRQKFMS